MLAHVHGPSCSGKPDEAIDVLRTGIAAVESSSSSSSSSSLIDKVALLLAWSDAEAARGDLRGALRRAASARDALAEGEENKSSLSLCLRLLVADASVRNSLALPSFPSSPSSSSPSVSGAGETALLAESELELELAVADAASLSSLFPGSAVAQAAASGIKALFAHGRRSRELARGAAEEVAKALPEAERDIQKGEEESETATTTAAAAAALASLAASRAAGVLLACEQAPAAIELYSKAVELAERARRRRKEGDENQFLILSPLAAADASLASLCGRAQALSFSALPLSPPQEASKDAGDALSAFDAEIKDLQLRRPEAVASPLLLILAQVSSRSGQVLVAEGLFRRGGQLLGVLSSPSSSSSKSANRDVVSPSVASALAWRHAQLLTALPQRGREAGELAEAAAAINAKEEEQKNSRGGGAPSSSSSSLEACRSELESSLGTLDALTGKGNKGTGVGVDAAARTVLPWLV